MGVAASNRGSRLVMRDADEQMPVAQARAERDALKDALLCLEAENVALRRDLRRARRCLASNRVAAAMRTEEHRERESRSDAAIRILTKIAFRGDVEGRE
jgi:hypothetical protein